MRVPVHTALCPERPEGAPVEEMFDQPEVGS